jgi:hypothetical protein
LILVFVLGFTHMARYDHLPIWRDAVRLATLLEEAVRRFGKTPSPPRHHKYALGADLRRQHYAVCRFHAELLFGA